MIDLALPPGPLRVLCLGAHPDDVEIGCGATLLALGARRELTATVFVLTGTAQRQDEASKAAALFLPGTSPTFGGLPDGRLPAQWGTVKDGLEALAATTPKPDLVFAPRADDAHQDHRLVAELVTTAWRDSLVLHYEIPKWDGDVGPANAYVPVDEATAHRKYELLTQCYPSQTDRDWWDEEMFLGRMRLRGMECRSRYAEAFVVRKATITL